MKNNHQNIPSYILYIASFFQRYFFQLQNEYDDLYSRVSARVHHVLPSVETGCLPCSSTISEINRSATNIFRSLDIRIERISLSFGSITTHSQMYYGPPLIMVSSITYSNFLFLLGYFF